MSSFLPAAASFAELLTANYAVPATVNHVAFHKQANQLIVPESAVG